ncbi:MAG: SRPBCC family protein [Deltaproteobacteria bacterium]|nr:SRPBCC family protein [Deltaproteobacteria bacterium]
MIVLYILLGLVATVLIVAALMPSRYAVSKSTVIQRPPLDVYGKIADLRHYKEWNPWQKTDPGATFEITGPPDTVGHRYRWSGKKVGEGSLTVRTRDPGRSVEFDLQFIKPWATMADDRWRFEPDGPDGASTRVTWSNGGPLPYPMARLIGPMLSKTLNAQFEAGLRDLKALCERG